MTILINHKYNKLKKNPKNLVFFVNEKFNISELRKNFTNSEFSYVQDILKTTNSKKKILAFELNSKKKVFLI